MAFLYTITPVTTTATSNNTNSIPSNSTSKVLSLELASLILTASGESWPILLCPCNCWMLDLLKSASFKEKNRRGNHVLVRRNRQSYCFKSREEEKAPHLRNT
ncbi:hypothetical protein HOLleu_41814 [Holothuria leucospilota]|uniref:Uncharacterized protein n=1 Tax=Holothuria leucospilota TaxID=206669 RepID=A0A9Q1BC24_HOLLE|nr:hypothetical protein HOLleu_41814 [Holothuria leucospilota]